MASILIPMLLFMGIVAVVIGYRLMSARRDRLFAESGVMLGFMPDEEPAWLPDVPLLGKRDAEVLRPLSGTVQGFQASVFDFKFAEGRNTFCKTVLAVYKPGLNIPAFELRNHSFVDGIAAKFSGEFISFDQYPEFAKRFTVKSPDPDRIGMLFSPDKINSLLALSDASYHVEGYIDAVLVYGRGRVRTSRLVDFINEAGQLGAAVLTNAPTSIVQ